MEMHQIRYFLAVCEHGSFSRAAETCDVSQPAMTAAIRKLEEETRAPLFHREGKRLVLTDLGRMMKPHFEQVLGETHTASEIAKNFRLLKSVPLKFGVMPTIGPVRLARFLERFRQGNTGIDLAVHEAPLDLLVKRLEAGELDLAVLNAPDGLDDTFRSEPIYVESYVVVFPPGHPFERLSGVSLNDVSGHSYVDRLSCEMREMVRAVCADRKVELYAAFRSEREDWIQAMVLANLGFAFMPEYSVTLSGLLSRPLVDPPLKRTVIVADVRGRQRSPAAQIFMQGIRSYNWPG